MVTEYSSDTVKDLKESEYVLERGDVTGKRETFEGGGGDVFSAAACVSFIPRCSSPLSLRVICITDQLFTWIDGKREPRLVYQRNLEATTRVNIL